MILTIALLAAQPVASGAATQWSCTLVGPGDRAPTTLDLDYRSKKQPNAQLVFSPDSAFVRTSSTSPVARGSDGAMLIAFATGNGQYRHELTPQGAAMRLRVTGAGATRPTLAQGYCSARAGKPLKVKGLATLAVDDAPAAPRPWKLQPQPVKLPAVTCRLIGPDRRVAELHYQVAAAQGNELTAAVQLNRADLIGTAQASGSGTQFFLVTPAERLIATTVSLPGATPAYVHLTFERTGNWVDLGRGGQALAVGDCGPPLPALLAAPGALQ